MSLASLRRTWGAYLPASTPFVVKKAAKIFVWIGLLLLLLAATFALHIAWSVRSFVRTEATVSENVATQDAQGGVIYVTHLRFQLPGGRIVNFVDPIKSSENGDPSFATGKIVPVLYPLDHLERAQVATIWRLYFVANILGILGVVCVDIGLILRLLLKRAAKRTITRN